MKNGPGNLGTLGHKTRLTQEGNMTSNLEPVCRAEWHAIMASSAGGGSFNMKPSANT